ncbi:MAG: hypothetical protein FJ109_00510 [Deltaproteobacteria bacterium]|nr:hypothetical protein [Deltaproteobacteria bacterium]
MKQCVSECERLRRRALGPVWGRLVGFLAVLALGSCGSEEAGPGTSGTGPPAGCSPGKIQGCICEESGEAGIRLCGESRYWSACDCTGKLGSCEGDVCTGPDAAPEGPGAAVPSSRSELAGGASLESPNYRLRLFVAPARPVQVSKTKNYGLILGPGGTSW